MRKASRLSLTGLVAVVLWFSAVSCSSGAADRRPLTTVTNVDLERYAGSWFEIARLPNRFQDDCSGNTTAEYSLREDGRITVVNRCATLDGREMEAEGVARVVDKESGAKLKVRFAPAFLSFIPAVWGDYWIIELDPDYAYAVIGEPGRRYLWILSRSPGLPEETVREIVERIRDHGFDVDRLLFTDQPG